MPKLIFKKIIKKDFSIEKKNLICAEAAKILWYLICAKAVKVLWYFASVEIHYNNANCQSFFTEGINQLLN